MDVMESFLADKKPIERLELRLARRAQSGTRELVFEPIRRFTGTPLRPGQLLLIEPSALGEGDVILAVEEGCALLGSPLRRSYQAGSLVVRVAGSLFTVGSTRILMI